MKLDIQKFANSLVEGTITFSASGNLQGRIKYEESNISITDNSTKITATLYARRTDSYTTTGKSWNGYVTINGSKHSFSSLSSSTSVGSSWVEMKTYTNTISHDTDGSSTITIKGSITGPSGTTLESYTSKGSESVELYTIPRASTITSVSSNVMDYAPSVVWTPFDSSFLFKVKYTYNNYSYTSDYISPNSTSEYTYSGHTLYASTLAPYNTSSNNFVFTCNLYTYDSDYNQIGYDTKTFQATLNSSIAPTINSITLSEADTTMSSLGWGIWVQGKSKVAGTINASGIYGSTISSYSTSLNGYTYSNSSFTSNTLTSSGSLTLMTTITDSRSNTATSTQSLYVYPYSNPSFTIAQVYRCDENGNEDDEGAYLHYTFSGSVSSCNGNNKGTYKIGYKLSTDSTYTTITISSNVQSLNTSGILSSGGTAIEFDTSSSYDILFTITDSFTSSTNLQEIDTGFDLMNFNASGKSMAIGKVSEASSNEELLEIALETNIDNDLQVNNSVIVGELTGKNLYNLNETYSFTSNNTTWYFIDGTSGAYGSDIGTKTDLKVKVENGKQYTIKINTITNAVGGQLVYDDETIIINGTNLLTSGQTFTASKNGYVLLRFRVESGKTATISKVQLEKGTNATDYFSFNRYGYNSVDSMGNIVVDNISNKNLANINNTQFGYAWNWASNSGRAILQMECEPNTTYTISFTDISGISNMYNFEKTSASDTTTTSGVSEITATKTITTQSNSYILGIQFIGSALGISDIEAIGLQVEKGDTATTYSKNQNFDSNSYLKEIKIATTVSSGKVVFTLPYSYALLDTMAFISYHSNTNNFGGVVLVLLAYNGVIISHNEHNASSFSISISKYVDTGVSITINESNISSSDTFSVKAIRTISYKGN